MFGTEFGLPRGQTWDRPIYNHGTHVTVRSILPTLVTHPCTFFLVSNALYLSPGDHVCASRKQHRNSGGLRL